MAPVLSTAVGPRQFTSPGKIGASYGLFPTHPAPSPWTCASYTAGEGPNISIDIQKTRVNRLDFFSL